MSGVVPQQFSSGESERAEAARGCSICSKKGHNARTCPNAKPAAPEAPKAKEFEHPCPHGVRKGAVHTLQSVRVYEGEREWDMKTSIIHLDARPAHRGKWQIWKDPATGWVFVWHDVARRIIEIGPGNVAFLEPFEG